MLKISTNKRSFNIEIDDFYSHELRIGKLKFNNDEHNVVLTYVHEKNTNTNNKNLLSLLLLLDNLIYVHHFDRSSITVVFEYLPFSRMDKEDEQYEQTLKPFMNLVSEKAGIVITNSVHNPGSGAFDVGYFVHLPSPQVGTVEDLKTHSDIALVAVDEGALVRYGSHLKFDVVFQKKRVLGDIIEQVPIRGEDILENTENAKYVLIDDICSKGTTFVNVGKEIKKYNPNAELYLYVHFMESEAYDAGLSKELFELFDEVHFEKFI